MLLTIKNIKGLVGSPNQPSFFDVIMNIATLITNDLHSKRSHKVCNKTKPFYYGERIINGIIYGVSACK